MAEQLVFAPASKKQEMFLNSNSTITLAGGAAGSGKALRHGEKVLTKNGFVNIENIKIGDSVVTPKNTVETVIGVYPQGLVDIYRITFQDGSTVDTCGNHLWKWRKGGTSKYIVSSTLDILDWMNSRKKNVNGYLKKAHVDLIDPAEYGEKKELKIHPYVLGVLLGDGSISTRSISISCNDDELIDKVKSLGYDIKEWNKNSDKTKCYGVRGIQQEIRDLKLLGCNSYQKFIPEEYLTASIDDRFALIQGLMDTDGYVSKDGSTEFCTISPSLRDGITTILRSLGFTVTCSIKYPFYKNNKGERVYGKTAYNLYIRGKNQPKLFSLKRKVERTKNKNVSNSIKSIEKVEQDHATCISISGDDKLFITSNFIPTHNTYTALLIALKFMQYPRATGVIFRRTSKMLTAPGSIWHEAVNMFTAIYGDSVKIKSQALEMHFPNGAILKFSHMQHESNMYDHKGGQYSLVIFDEATDFTQSMITYLLSRMRNAYVGHSPQMFLMTNPDYNSFLRLWIQDYYLDSRGIPIEERAGNERYYFMQGNTLIWYSTRQEAEAVHGTGEGNGVGSFTFIGANCRDNPPLLKAQPDYISRLMNLPRVEKERLLDGSWFARLENAGYFKREWCEMIESVPIHAKRKKVRVWDFAFSKPSEAYPNPDWTRGTLLSKDTLNFYTVENIVSLRDRVHEVETLVFDTAERDGREVTISIPLDPAAAAGAYARDLQRRLAERGFHVKLTKPVKSKLTRFAPFASIAQAGYLRVVIDPEWNEHFFDELEIFDGVDKKKKDDIVDTCSDGVIVLNKDLQLPNFSLPDVGSVKHFGFQNQHNLPTGQVESVIFKK